MEIAITDHAARRYVDRVDSTMTTQAARRYLAGSLDGVPLRTELSWAGRKLGWLAEIDPGVAVVVRLGHNNGLTGTTVVTRGGA